MKTLMYPIAPEDDFPDMFCAIRQGSGEHWFYVPEGESASELLLRMEVENAKLRELCEDMLSCIEIRAAFNRPPTTKMYEEFAQQARELGLEVD